MHYGIEVQGRARARLGAPRLTTPHHLLAKAVRGEPLTPTERVAFEILAQRLQHRRSRRRPWTT